MIIYLNQGTANLEYDITTTVYKELQLIWVQLQLIWVCFFECALGHVDQIHIYIYVDICDVNLHVQI